MAIRSYGLSGSGMDIDQMVKDMMKAQRGRYDNLVQKRTQLEWKKTDYNTMYNDISDFRKKVFDYKLSSNVAPKLITSSNENIAKILATGDAANVTHDLEVINLAKGVTLTSQTDKISGSNSKDTLAKQFGLTPDTTFLLKIKNGTGEKEITVDTSKSIYDLVSDINKAGINVRADYNASLDRFFLSTTNTGATASLDFSNSSSAGVDFLRDNLKLDVNLDPADLTKPADPTKNIGTDAKIILDSATITQSTNNFAIAGITYNLKGEGKASIAITPDKDKTFENVKAFVETYNNILKKISDEIQEAKYKDFLPLTDAQKKELKEADIKAWEEKARSGTLRRDPILTDAINQMRNAIANAVGGIGGKYTTLSSIGIMTSPDWLENGKLYINETKLKKAIDEDPDIINKLFASTSDVKNNQGIAARLDTVISGAMSKIGREAGFTPGIEGDTKSNLAEGIRGYSKQLNTLAQRLKDMEDSYYKKFNAMEQALSRLSQQSNWLTSQLSQ